jgi:hypothetical protein
MSRENNRKERFLKCHVLNLSAVAFCMPWDVRHLTHRTRPLSRNILGSTFPFFLKNVFSLFEMRERLTKLGTHPIFNSDKSKAWHQNLGCQASQDFLVPLCPNS